MIAGNNQHSFRQIQTEPSPEKMKRMMMMMVMVMEDHICCRENICSGWITAAALISCSIGHQTPPLRPEETPRC